MLLNIESIKRKLISLILSDYEKILEIFKSLKRNAENLNMSSDEEAEPATFAMAAEWALPRKKKIKESSFLAPYAEFNKRIEQETDKLQQELPNVSALRKPELVKSAINFLLEGGLTPEDVFDAMFLFRPSNFLVKEKNGLFELNEKFKQFISKRSDVLQKAVSFLKENKFSPSGWSKMILNGELVYFLVLPPPYKVFIMVHSTISWHGLSLLSGINHGNMSTSMSIRVTLNSIETGKLIKQSIIIQKSEDQSSDINAAATKVANVVGTMALRLSEMGEKAEKGTISDQEMEKMRIFYDPNAVESIDEQFKKVKNALESLNSFNSANVNFYGMLQAGSLFVPDLFITKDIMLNFSNAVKNFAEHYYMINFSPTKNVAAAKIRSLEKVDSIISEQSFLRTVKRWKDIQRKILIKENSQKTEITASYEVPENLSIEYVKKFYDKIKNTFNKSADEIKNMMMANQTLKTIYTTNKSFFDKSNFFAKMANELKTSQIKPIVLKVSQKQTNNKYEEYYFLIFLGNVKKTFILFETSAIKKDEKWSMKEKHYGALRLHLLDENFNHIDPSFYAHDLSRHGEEKIPRLSVKMTRGESNIGDINAVSGLEANFIAMCVAAYMIEKFATLDSDISWLEKSVSEKNITRDVSQKLAYVVGFNRYVEQIAHDYFGEKYGLKKDDDKNDGKLFDPSLTLRANFNKYIRGNKSSQSSAGENDFPINFDEQELENIANALQNDGNKKTEKEGNKKGTKSKKKEEK